jgi:hypothetical protein
MRGAMPTLPNTRSWRGAQLKNSTGTLPLPLLMEQSGQLHAPAALPQRKSPCYPLDSRLGGPQSRSGRGGEEKNSQPLPGLKPPIIQPGAQSYTTELSRARLSVDGKKNNGS